ncbi:MAG: hypothetical protein U0350_21555 [Caldilineaceae bacterium]
MLQCQRFLFNDRLMYPFAMPTRAVTPGSHGTLIQPIRLHNGLDRAAIDQQSEHKHDQGAVAVQPRKQAALPAAESFSTALTLILLPLAPVAYNIPDPTLPSCITKFSPRYLLME